MIFGTEPLIFASNVEAIPSSGFPDGVVFSTLNITAQIH
jgi:hypothetical protein